VPVTITWGERDRLLLPRQAWRAAREIPLARIVALRLRPPADVRRS
jgi:hypothetical protein